MFEDAKESIHSTRSIGLSVATSCHFVGKEARTIRGLIVLLNSKLFLICYLTITMGLLVMSDWY